MKIIQSSDYRIYIDNVRMDPYIKSWSAGCGLTPSDATATITMYRTEKLEKWKAYLAQVRILARNNFSGKYAMVFEGEIMNRGYADQRNDSGELTFSCKGFYHWLDVPIPLMINNEDALDFVTRFQYEAQNIDVDAVLDIMNTEAEMNMKGLTIEEVIESLFEKMNSGYYLDSDSSFRFADLEKRFKVMGDIIKQFRDSGYLDLFTFTRNSTITSFYVYLNQILTQMMFEFYQDRDGALRIKPPSWSDSILKHNILDEAIISNVTGFNDWENEPTRVLVIGGKTDTGRTGGTSVRGNTLHIPMGLYIGEPGKGTYFSQVVEVLLQEYGLSGDFASSGGPFYDDLSGKYTITGEFGEQRSGHKHGGTDFAMPSGTPVSNIGFDGVVKLQQKGHPDCGNWLIITQNIEGQEYDFTYMHMSTHEVKVGDKVASGQTMGTSGSTGRSTGPHLHFEVSKGPRREQGSTALDPLKFLKEMSGKYNAGGAGSETASASGSGEQAKFMNRDLKNTSKLTADQLNKWINSKAKKTSVMYNKGNAFFEAAKQSGLDPIYLVAHAAQETGWGTSDMVKKKFNFYGIAAFDSSPGSATKWGGADTGIISGAVWIRKNFYDKGQNTLYKMRYSSNGKHNYATAKDWPNKIADIMKGYSSASSSTTDGSASSGGSSSGGGTANASTGGFGVSTNIFTTGKSSAYRAIAKLPGSIKNADKKSVPVEYKAFSNYKFQYPYPYSAREYQTIIRANPNGVEAQLVCCIIEVMSKWKEKYKANDRYGLMGVPLQYINMVLGKDTTKILNPSQNIHHGTLIFKSGYSKFNNKVTFGLATLWNGGASAVEAAVGKAGKVDFTKIRTLKDSGLAKGTVAFVDEVINTYVELFGGNYIKGDPHLPIYVDNNLVQGKIDTEAAEDTQPDDYESSYKPIMSEEERLYKVNLKISEQLLIRYDIDNALNADDLVQRYAEYMMQLYRAESHGVTVNLSTCLPSLRPGFNAWLEPTRKDVVFYITRVSHTGSFGMGSTTTVSGGFVRDPKNYDKIEDNIFVSESHVKAKDFGSVIQKANMSDMRATLKSLHTKSDEVVTDSRNVPTLSKLYSSATITKSEYMTRWSGEYATSTIEEKIKNIYKDAPPVVKKRAKKLKEIVEESKDFFTKKLLKTTF